MSVINNPNIIFIVIDTLRKDFSGSLYQDVLSKYGFVSYENVITPSPWTTPAHASMFTGLYPILHGAHESRVRKDINVILENGRHSLPNLLKHLGYKTILFSANPFIKPSTGFKAFSSFHNFSFNPKILELLSKDERKFIDGLKKAYSRNRSLNILRDLIKKGRFSLLLKYGIEYLLYRIYRYPYIKYKKWPLEKGSKDIVDMLKDIFNVNKDESVPYFIFINFMEVHEPYYMNHNPVDEISDSICTGNLDVNISRKWIYGYSKEAKYISSRIDDLFSYLNESNFIKNSLIVVTSDHGQLLGEYNMIGHGIFLYDELLKVPLFIKYPEELRLKHFSDVDEHSYVSLIRLKELILDVVRKLSTGEEYSDKLLYSDTVYSESYGIHIQAIADNIVGRCRDRLSDLEKYRIKIYYNGHYGVFNVAEWGFEEFSDMVGDKILGLLKDRLKAFFKTNLNLKQRISLYSH